VDAKTSSWNLLLYSIDDGLLWRTIDIVSFPIIGYPFSAVEGRTRARVWSKPKPLILTANFWGIEKLSRKKLFHKHTGDVGYPFDDTSFIRRYHYS
jgi:hypothetical protein